MAIKNASDLLVYRTFPSAIAQVTRVRVKSVTPLIPADGSVTGTFIIKNSFDASGSIQGDITTGSITTANNKAAGSQAVLDKIRGAIVTTLGGYTVGGEVVDGDFTYRDFTNIHLGNLSANLSFADGTASIPEGNFIVDVITSGQDAAYTPIAFSTSASISFTNDVRDITNKDSGGAYECLSGLRSFEMTTEALQDFNADVEFQEFFNDFKNKTKVTLRFSERLTGGSDKYYEGSAFISSLSMNTGVEDNATYSVTFKGTASVVEGTH